jgi:hypothetical protein
MKIKPAVISGPAALSLAAALHAQPAPTTPPPSAGLLNDWLRQQAPELGRWDLGGQFRPRLEHKEHFAVPGTPDAVDFRADNVPTGNTYWLFRTKVHLGYSPADWLRVYAEGRDSFTENDRRNPNPETDRADLHQAYVALGGGQSFPLSATVGRQELRYGDERLIGSFDWNNIGRVFDAAKARYQAEGWWVDAFVGRVVVPVNDAFNVANDYDWFSGLYASTRALCPKQETQFYFLARNTGAGAPHAVDHPLVGLPTPRDLYTLGARFKSLPGELHGWDYTLEAAGQFGRFKESATGPALDHAAFALTAGAGYTVPTCPMNTRLGLEYNFASGDSDPNDDQHETFDNLFPTNHKFYGYMDFASWQNLHNPRFNLSFKPARSLTVTLDYHLFWLADTADYFYAASGAPRRGAPPGSGAGYDRNPGYDNFVGSELDVVLTYAPQPWLNAQAGYGHFFAGDYVRQSLAAPGYGSSDADWVYAQLTFNF